MKLLKADSYLKGILLLAAGIIVTFLPSALSALFYIAGALIIGFYVVTMIIGKTNGTANVSMTNTIIGIVLGIVVMLFPKLLSFGIPVIVGVVLAISGINGIIKALERKKNGSTWIFNIVAAGVLAIAGVTFIFNPFGTSKTFIKLLGFALIIVGIVIIALTWYRSNNNSSGGVVDVDDYTVK